MRICVYEDGVLLHDGEIRPGQIVECNNPSRVRVQLVKDEKDKCRLCGSVDVRLTDQKDLFTNEWVKVLLCKKCGKMTEAEV